MRWEFYGICFAFAFNVSYADEGGVKKSQVATEPATVASLSAANDRSSENAKAAASGREKFLPHRIAIGGNYTYAWITPSGNPTTKGSLGGGQMIYEYCPPRSVYAAVAFNWRIGNTKREEISRSLQDFNTQERIGYTFFNKDHQLTATLFSGIGARYLPEKVSIDATSVDFNYTEFYVPVGCLFEKRFNENFSWGINFHWMPQIFPTVRIIPLSGTQWMLTYQLNNFFIESPFKISTSDNRFFLTLAPFFEQWHDGASTAETTNGVAGPVGLVLGLPGNSYLFAGVNVNFGATF